MTTENTSASTNDLLLKADKLRLAGSFTQAQEILENLIQQNLFFSPAKLALGRVFFESGHLESAKITLEEFCEFVPDHPLANKILAKIYLHFSQHTRAKKKIEMVIQANPEDTFARRMHEQIQDQSSTERNADDEETKKNIVPTKTATIAEIYRSQGHFKEALNIYQDLLKQNKDHPDYKQKIQEIQTQMSQSAKPVEPIQPQKPQFVKQPAKTAPAMGLAKPQVKELRSTDKKTKKEKLERLLHLVQQYRGSHVRS